MFSEVHEATITLMSLTGVHIGTGNFVEFDGAGDTKPEAAAICRDGRGRPYIPGSSIKGRIRAVACLADPTEIGALFGEISDGDTGHMGLLTVYGACAINESAPDVSKMPYGSGRKDGVYISARTAINAETGTAQEHFLSFREMAAPGWQFRLRLTLRRPKRLPEDSDRWVKALSLFKQVLKTLDGSPLVAGKGGADGDGTLEATSISTDIKFKSAEPLPSPFVTRSLELVCDGPFIVADSSYDPEASGLDRQDTNRVQTKAQRLDDDRPLISGSSISGAMRARMSRLASIDTLRAAPNSPLLNGDAAENRVTEMFGTQERASRLRLANLRVKAKGKWRLTQTAIDRLTSGVIDGKLFSAEVFHGVLITLDLQHSDEIASDVDQLVKDIEINGLDLGAGAAKGFGWFRATSADTSDRSNLIAVTSASLPKPDNAAASGAKQTLNPKLLTTAAGIFKADRGNISEDDFLEALDTHLGEGTYDEDEAVALLEKLRAGEQLPNSTSKDTRELEARYRFVELNDKIVPAEAGATASLDQPGANLIDADLDMSWIFDTPFLIGEHDDKGVARPLKLGQRWAIPGSTLRGCMRAILEIACFGRMSAVDQTHAMMAPILERSNERHVKPRLIENSNPPQIEADMVEALFGYAFEAGTFDPGDYSPAPNSVARKGRIFFSSAFTDKDAFKPSPDLETVMLGPKGLEAEKRYVVGGHTKNPNARLAGRKRFVPRFKSPSHALRDNPDSPFHALSNVTNRGGDTVSKLQLLEPRDNTSEFSSRIRLRGVTLVEMGALLWALTLGNRPELRHMIGRAKGFGAGQMRARVTIARADFLNGEPLDPVDTWKAFTEYMNQKVPGWTSSPQLQDLFKYCHPDTGASLFSDGKIK